MKKNLLIFVLLSVFCGKNTNLKAQTPFNPNTYSGWLTTPDNYFSVIPAAAGVTFSQPSRGAGNQFSTATDGINAGQWQNASAADALAANRYFKFSAAANSTTTFTVDSILLILGRSSTGPDSCMLQYKSPGTGYNFVPFTSGVQVILNPATNPTTSLLLIPAAPITVSAGDSLVFRLTAWHASSSLGKLKIVNNTQLFGTSTAVVSNSIAAPLVQSSGTVCVSPVLGDSVQVSFNSTGAFNAGNTYSLELSDASGSFSNPQVIGSISSSLNNGTISAFIPAGTASADYQLRISSSDPAVNGLDTSHLMVNSGIVLSASVIQPTCPDSTGTIALTVSGGTGSIEYDWSNGDTLSSLANLVPGAYSVNMTDAVGCANDSSFNILSILDFLVTDSIVDVLCNSGTTGSVHVTVDGGTSPYTVTWSGNGINQTGLSATNLPAGNYLIQISDANNCPYSMTYQVTEPAEIVATDVISNVNCNSGSDGSIQVSVSGGTAPYTAAWSGNGINQTGLTASNLMAGNYTISLLDVNNCAFSDSYTVTEPTPLNLSASITHAVCATCNGTIIVTATGGTAPYSFEWDNNSTLSQISAIPGTYCVEISDANACEADTCFTISSTAGIENETDNTTVQIYPNPVSETLQIVFSAGFQGIRKEIRVTNLSGELVFNELLDPQADSTSVPVKNWAEGMYTYRIFTENAGFETGKIQVIH